MRVLLVDDHELFRSGLRELLDEDDFVVAEAASGDEAVRRVAASPPDVVVMDINMPGMSGVEATRRICELQPGMPVLMLTVASDDENVLAAVRAGARGYLLKDAQLEDIAAGIRGAASGQSVIAPRVAGGLVTHLRDDSGAGKRESNTEPQVELSSRERQILALLAAGADNAAIAAQLYLSRSTVKNHVSAILEKLGVENRVQAAVFAIRHGLGEDPPAH